MHFEASASKNKRKVREVVKSKGHPDELEDEGSVLQELQLPPCLSGNSTVGRHAELYAGDILKLVLAKKAMPHGLRLARVVGLLLVAGSARLVVQP